MACSFLCSYTLLYASFTVFFWIDYFVLFCVFFFQAEDGIRDAQESRGLGDVYKRQAQDSIHPCVLDILQEIDRLDDQGIDVIGIQAQLIPRMRDHRPEQMAKWPIIFKN